MSDQPDTQRDRGALAQRDVPPVLAGLPDAVIADLGEVIFRAMKLATEIAERQLADALEARKEAEREAEALRERIGALCDERATRAASLNHEIRTIEDALGRIRKIADEDSFCDRVPCGCGSEPSANAGVEQPAAVIAPPLGPALAAASSQPKIGRKNGNRKPQGRKITLTSAPVDALDAIVATG